MAMRSVSVTLKSGSIMPMIGLGTWRSNPEVMTNVIKDAIDLGYRHFDCAHIYGNEREIGLALEEKIKAGAVERKDLFLTSKLWNTFHQPDLVEKACRLTLENLKTDYLDLYLIHWPMGYRAGVELRPQNSDGKLLFSDVDFRDTWRAMEQLVDQKLCVNIGLSNFNIAQMKSIMDMARIAPQVLQIENHPYLQQNELLKFCQEQGIVVTAYSPLGSGHTSYAKPGDHPLLEHPKILEIAQAHNCSPAQVLIRYQVQRGNVVVPRSITKDHMAANLQSCNIELNDNDMIALRALDMGAEGRIVRMDDCCDHPLYPFQKK